MRRYLHLLNAAIRVGASCLIAVSAFSPLVRAQTGREKILQPTPVAGESWLQHLHRSFDETSMGKTGQLGPAAAAREEAEGQTERLARQSANDGVILHGSDLYRANCRGCHGVDGEGAPPEINSVLNPVRATSTDAVMLRMKAIGMGISRADAANLARQSKAMLLERLHHGGQDMPAFPHLREAEINALIAYLRQLAGVRGAEPDQLAVRETRVQVGEHIVKSTCHVCHGAAGPNPTAQQLYEGAIPPLNTLTHRVSEEEFVRKVTRGAPVMMGTPPELFRGRMPVFYYLSEEEAADVYLYLKQYPPYQWAVIEPASPATLITDGDAAGLPPLAVSEVVPTGGGRGVLAAGTDVRAQNWLALLGVTALALLGLSFGITVYELKRLSVAAELDAGCARRRLTQYTDEPGQFREAANDGADREWVAQARRSVAPG